MYVPAVGHGDDHVGFGRFGHRNRRPGPGRDAGGFMGDSRDDAPAHGLAMGLAMGGTTWMVGMIIAAAMLHML